MSKILAADGIPVMVGDVVTKAETTAEIYWAFGLIEGIVTGVPTGTENDIPLCTVRFEQVIEEGWVNKGEEYLCRVCDLLHIGAENTYTGFQKKLSMTF